METKESADQLLCPGLPKNVPAAKSVESRSTVASEVKHPAIALITARPDLFARQGSVNPTWRQRNGKTFGPYFRLSYRDDGRQCAIYLGRDGPLVEHVRHLLQRTQNPLRQKRIFDRIDRETRSALRDNNLRLAALLRPLGLRLKGFEVRGWRTSLLRPWLSPKSTHSARQQSLATAPAGSGHPHERSAHATPLHRLA